MQKDHFAPVKNASALKSKFRALSKRYGPDKPEYDAPLFTEINAQYNAYLLFFEDGTPVPNFALTREQRDEKARAEEWSEHLAQENSDHIRQVMTHYETDALKTPFPTTMPQQFSRGHAPYRVWLAAKFRKEQMPDLMDYDFDGFIHAPAAPAEYSDPESDGIATAVAAAKHPLAALMLLSLVPRLDTLGMMYTVEGLTLWLSDAKKKDAPKVEPLGFVYSDGRKAWYYPAIQLAAQQQIQWNPTAIDLSIMEAGIAALALPAPTTQDDVAPPASAKAKKEKAASPAKEKVASPSKPKAKKPSRKPAATGTA